MRWIGDELADKSASEWSGEGKGGAEEREDKRGDR